MRSKLIGAGLIAGLCSMTAFAEQPVQAGETLESLSKAKITTTVNGQPGSLADLVNSGQVQVISAQPSARDAMIQTAPVSSPQDMQAVTPQPAQMNEPAVAPEQVDPNAANALPESPEQEPIMQAAPVSPQDQNMNAAPEQMAEPDAQ